MCPRESIAADAVAIEGNFRQGVMEGKRLALLLLFMSVSLSWPGAPSKIVLSIAYASHETTFDVVYRDSSVAPTITDEGLEQEIEVGRRPTSRRTSGLLPRRRSL